jgi:hypothetical protein
MRRTGFALALLSAIAMTVVPVAPSFASAKHDRAAARQAFVDHAARGDVIVLSPTQMNELAVSNPGLHAKLDAAHQTGQVPSLTKSEKQVVNALTQRNMADIKAGAWPVAAWIIIAVVGLILFTPIFCGIFPFGLACAPVGAAVRVRG